MSQDMWTVYILRCKDGTLYTGITDNLKRRLAQHREGKGAKYTRGRSPLTLRYVETFDSKGAALRREYEIKQLCADKKRRLISASPILEEDI